MTKNEFFGIDMCFDLITELDTSKEKLLKKQDEITKEIQKIEAAKEAIQELHYIIRDASLMNTKEENIQLKQEKVVKKSITEARMIELALTEIAADYGMQIESNVTIQNGVKVIRNITIPKKLFTIKEPNEKMSF